MNISVSEDFDEDFYLSKYPITKDYYNTSNLSLRERLFHHYINFGKKSGYFKNRKEYRDKVLGNDFEIDEDFDEDFYLTNFSQSTNYLEDSFLSLRERMFHHYLIHGKKLKFYKNSQEFEADQFLKSYASLIVCCMNKEDNLIKILPSWIDLDRIREIIIVDYSSKIPLLQNENFKKIKSDKIKVITVEGENSFNLGKAYNLAVDFCNFNTIIKIDCDYKCKNSKWLDLIFNHKEKENIFIHGDWKFSKSHTGFFVIDKSKFRYFREDLNGYGHDELDLYKRIRKKYPDINEIVWFDIENSIEHLDHNDEVRTKNYLIKDKEKSLEINIKLCKFYNKLIRNSYILENEKVIYKKEKINKIFCINIKDNKERWEKVKYIPQIERIDAIKINKDLQKYELYLDPVDISSELYFKINPNAVGCYLSHYFIWQKIVSEKIPFSLVLEDDVDSNSVINFLSSNIILNDFELIQLSKRIRKKKKRIIFDGGESYILSLSGAEKLINLTKNPCLLYGIKPDRIENIKYLCKKNLIKDRTVWSNKKSITCPVDKFMGYCCEKKLPKSLRLKSFIYPIIDLDKETSAISNINNVELREISEQKLLNAILN